MELLERRLHSNAWQFPSVEKKKKEQKNDCWINQAWKLWGVEVHESGLISPLNIH